MFARESGTTKWLVRRPAVLCGDAQQRQGPDIINPEQAEPRSEIVQTQEQANATIEAMLGD
jgi:hypothetical protein